MITCDSFPLAPVHHLHTLSFSHTHTHLHNGTPITLPWASDSMLTFHDCVPEVCFLIYSGNLQFGYLFFQIKSMTCVLSFSAFSTFLFILTQRRKATLLYLRPVACRLTMTNQYSIINRLQTPGFRTSI